MHVGLWHLRLLGLGMLCVILLGLTLHTMRIVDGRVVDVGIAIRCLRALTDWMVLVLGLGLGLIWRKIRGTVLEIWRMYHIS